MTWLVLRYIKLREVAVSFQSCLTRERSTQGSSDQTTHTEGAQRNSAYLRWISISPTCLSSTKVTCTQLTPCTNTVRQRHAESAAARFPDSFKEKQGAETKQNLLAESNLLFVSKTPPL